MSNWFLKLQNVYSDDASRILVVLHMSESDGTLLAPAFLVFCCCLYWFNRPGRTQSWPITTSEAKNCFSLVVFKNCLKEAKFLSLLTHRFLELYAS
jgi:hypothetical protein